MRSRATYREPNELVVEEGEGEGEQHLAAMNHRAGGRVQVAGGRRRRGASLQRSLGHSLREHVVRAGHLAQREGGRGERLEGGRRLLDDVPGVHQQRAGAIDAGLDEPVAEENDGAVRRCVSAA